MKEQEAKTKWCPMIRFSNYGDRGASNRDYFKGAANTEGCVASACMLWREDLTREEAENGYHAESGYCGMGGKP